MQTIPPSIRHDSLHRPTLLPGDHPKALKLESTPRSDTGITWNYSEPNGNKELRATSRGSEQRPSHLGVLEHEVQGWEQ